MNTHSQDDLRTCAEQKNGCFIGSVVTEWCDDGRKMKLLKPFAYIDPAGTRWDAPQGWVVDGASIPKVAWSTIGGPFEGRYRNASVIHDVACDQKNRPWSDVHKAFYTAMLASNVSLIKAKIMYAAVHRFGPRWKHSLVLSNIPRNLVEPALAELRVAAAVGEHIAAEIDQAHQHDGIKNSNHETLTNLPLDTVNVVVSFCPDLSSVSGDISADFERLKFFIESENPSIEEIENYSL